MIEVDEVGGGQEKKLIHTFALRLARKCFLQQFCQEDHPVLSTELHLIEMARSKLQEHILATISLKDLPKMRPIIEAQIRMIAKNRVLVYIEVDTHKDAVIQVLDKESLDDIFPSVH